MSEKILGVPDLISLSMIQTACLFVQDKRDLVAIALMIGAGCYHLEERAAYVCVTAIVY